MGIHLSMRRVEGATVRLVPASVRICLAVVSWSIVVVLGGLLDGGHVDVLWT